MYLKLTLFVFILTIRFDVMCIVYVTLTSVAVKSYSSTTQMIVYLLLYNYCS